MGQLTIADLYTSLLRFQLREQPMSSWSRYSEKNLANSSKEELKMKKITAGRDALGDFAPNLQH